MRLVYEIESANYALQRTRHGVAVCNRCLPRAGSLSLDRSANQQSHPR